MSGIEAAGLALAILPLFISTIEHYDDILRPLSRYRNFTSKVQRFIDELETERTIYRTECQLLLATVAGNKTALDMLRDHRHTSWNNAVIRTRLVGQLGDLGATCGALISRINDKLLEIGKKSDIYGGLINQAEVGNSKGDKDWRLRVSTKLKFSFSEPSLRQSIKDLRSLNKAFLTLSNQAARLDRHYDMSPQQESGFVTHSTWIQLKRFKTVQQASQLLHDALSRACTAHREHAVQLCLAATCSDPCSQSEICRTRFSLALSRDEPRVHTSSDAETMGPSESGTTCDWFWFAIESVPSKSGEADGGWLAEECRPADTVTERSTHQKIVKKSLSGGKKAVDAALEAHSNTVGCDSDWDLCSKLYTSISKEHVGQADSPVYILGQKRGCKHVVQRPVILTGSRSSISMAQLISQKSGGNSPNEVPQYKRLRHAKALTIAVLQFHKTPWMLKSMTSDNLFFYKTSQVAPQRLQYSSAPYLNTTLTQKDLLGTFSSTEPSTSLANIVPNMLLFDLGILLLELAFNAPFKSLRQRDTLLLSMEATVTDLSETSVADYIVALRLADEVGISLGAGFASIVKKCLRCDFGCGNSLDIEALQIRLYEDVVCQLERLEEGFRKLQLDC